MEYEIVCVDGLVYTSYICSVHENEQHQLLMLDALLVILCTSSDAQ